MKKIYSLALSLVLGVSAFAQVDETFVFVNDAGEVVLDGTTINMTNYELDKTGEVVYPSGLSVRNNSAVGSYVAMEVDIKKINGGDFQICFPQTCQSKSTVTKFTTAAAAMAAGEVKDLQSEWLPDEKGECSVTYTICLMEFVPPFSFAKKANGASVTMNFAYNENSVLGIKEATYGKLPTNAAVYNLAGQAVDADYKGVIVKNGKKYLNK